MPDDRSATDLAPSERSAWVPVVIAVFLTAATCLLVNHCHQPPPALGADAPPELFSATRAFERLERILHDEAPHPLGTPANHDVRNRLVTEIEGLGLQPTVNTHWITDEGEQESALVRVHNVMAELPSSNPELPAILLACHYDSVPAGPGASDDGAAVAAILEVARILIAEAPLARPVILLFTDGEEHGLYGARGFAQFNPAAERVGMVLNFEARGSSGGSLMFETSAHNRWIVQQAARGLARPMSSSAYVQVYRLMPNSSDLTVFMRKGLPGMNFAYIGSPKHYHSPLDNLANLDPRSLQHHGENALGMVRQLLSANWEHAATNRGDAVYTDLFARWMIAWPASWGTWLAVVLFAAIAVKFSGTMRMQRWNGTRIARAAGCWLGVIVAATVFGWFGASLLKLAGAGSLWFPANMHFDVAAHALCGAIGALLVLVALRPAPVLLLHVHGLALALGAVVFSLTFPGFSYLCLLPAALCLAAVALQTPKFSSRVHLAVACAGLGIFTTVLCWPLLGRLPEALGVFTAAPVLGTVVAFMILPLAPLLTALTRPMLLRTSLALSIVASVFFVLALKTPAFTADSPQHLTLSFLEEEGAPEAQLSLFSWEAPVPKSLLDGQSVLDTPNPRFSRRGVPVAAAPAGLPAPIVEVIDHTSAEGVHTVRALLKPALPAQQILAGIPDSCELVRITAQDRDLAIPPGKAFNRKWLRLRGAPEEGLEVSVSWRGSPSLALLAVGITPGLPPHLEAIAKRRHGLNACPAGMGDQSIILRETLLEAP